MFYDAVRMLPTSRAYTAVSLAHDVLPDHQLVLIKTLLWLVFCSYVFRLAHLFVHIRSVFSHIMHPIGVDPAIRIVVVASVALLTRNPFFLLDVLYLFNPSCLHCKYLHLNILIIT